MPTAVISNPPFNLKADVHYTGAIFDRYGKPSSSNANYGFVLRALDLADLAVFIFPNAALSGSVKEDKSIIRALVQDDLVRGVIQCPAKMFRSTNIPVAIMVFGKNEKQDLFMADLTEQAETIIYDQKGQVGSKSHTERIYHSKMNAFSDSLIKTVSNAILGHEELDYLRWVSKDEIVKKDFDLRPRSYMDVVKSSEYRPVKEIVDDINKVKRFRNVLKLRINKKVLEEIGLGELEASENAQRESDKRINTVLPKFKANPLIRDDYLQVTKNKNEIAFINNDPVYISEILRTIFESWRTHIMFLNNVENELLAELRDAIAEALLNGAVDVSDIDIEDGD